MKKLLMAAVAVATLAGASWGQSFAAFESAFGGFADRMAASLAVNSTIGETWSDAYVGGFPHFGAGIGVGTAFTGVDSASPLFAALGQTAPAGLDRYGVPIPAIVAGVKLGLPFLGMDVGLKGGMISPEMASKLEAAYGVSAEYKNLGVQLRYALVKQTFLLPDLSLGLGLNYQQGRIRSSLGVGSKTLIDAEDIGSHTWTVTATDPMLDLGWESTTVDASLQVSKTLLFVLTPYAGLGYTVGKSRVTGGVASDLIFDDGVGGGDYSELAADFASAGGTAPSLSATGFSYTANSTDPVLRVYGGVSLNVLVVLDLQLMYIPSTKNLGASVMARLQL